MTASAIAAAAPTRILAISPFPKPSPGDVAHWRRPA
jgi:hypothetical protein